MFLPIGPSRTINGSLCMTWDAFTIFEQFLIFVTIGSQMYIAIRVIALSDGAEQYVRMMSFCTGFLMFLISRALRVTFADMMLIAHNYESTALMLLAGGIFPFVVGVFISELTIIALFIGKPVPIRMVLMIAAFTISQAAYTNFVAWTTQVVPLDVAFIPNLSYAIAVGLWLTFRFRGIKPGALSGKPHD
jgi:hypothetical protein